MRLRQTLMQKTHLLSACFEECLHSNACSLLKWDASPSSCSLRAAKSCLSCDWSKVAEQPWVPTGRMPNKPGPVSAGSGEIPLNRDNLRAPCMIALWKEVRCFIRGYSMLAWKCHTDLGFKGFGEAQTSFITPCWAGSLPETINPIMWGCESNEDYIGRACRLSRRCGTPLLCTRVLQSLMLKGDLLNRRWLKSGSGEIPLNEGHLAVPDRASSNTSSPYVSQVIPNIRKYIEHTAQTTHACAANAFFSIRQLQLCNTHAPTISISIYIYIYISESYYYICLVVIHCIPEPKANKHIVCIVHLFWLCLCVILTL